jgi:hypothetical protein
MLPPVIAASAVRPEADAVASAVQRISAFHESAEAAARSAFHDADKCLEDPPHFGGGGRGCGANARLDDSADDTVTVRSTFGPRLLHRRLASVTCFLAHKYAFNSRFYIIKGKNDR